MYGKNENGEAYQRTARPIVACAVDYPDSAHVRPHHHRRAQLVYAHQGLITICTPIGRWIVPPSRAVWIPPGIKHWHYMTGRVCMRTVFFEPAVVPHLSKICTVIAATPLLKELLLQAVRIPNAYPREGRSARLMQLIVDEIQIRDVLPLNLPMPSHPQTSQIAKALLQNLARHEELRDWATLTHSSERSLARHFQSDLGMTFGRWRQLARLHASLSLLAQGKGILHTAAAVGYESPSAFAAAFRCRFGTPPTRYFTEDASP